MDSSNRIAIENRLKWTLCKSRLSIDPTLDLEKGNSEKEKSFSFFSTGKMKIEVEIPLEVLKFRENLKFLARKKLEI